MPCELNHTMVQEGHARLQAHSHRCAVDFHKNVVGQVLARIHVHQVLDGADLARLARAPREHGARLVRPDHHVLRTVPEGDVSAVELLKALGEELRRALLDPVGQVAMAAPGTDQRGRREHGDPLERRALDDAAAGRAEGLDVAIEEGTSGLEAITRVASGGAEFGFADINALDRTSVV